MLRRLSLALAGLYLMAPLAALAVDDAANKLCKGANLADASGNCNTNANGVVNVQDALGVKVGDLTNALIYVVGAISVVVIIIGAIRYVISQGNSEQVKQARDTILYAIIGLVVAILAYAIVHFVNQKI